ncbi:MAG: FmdB family zinc ribbon protein [Deltaproteobacteria bacterium]
MPIYEYECRRCKEIFEIFHKIDEDCKVACPKCLGPAKKLISATNFVLKGSGFYVNDYPSKSRQDGKKNEKERTEQGTSPKSEEKKVEKKTEKKPD